VEGESRSETPAILIVANMMFQIVSNSIVYLSASSIVSCDTVLSVMQVVTTLSEKRTTSVFMLETVKTGRLSEKLRNVLISPPESGWMEAVCFSETLIAH
jgi:hypothetical protein